MGWDIQLLIAELWGVASIQDGGRPGYRRFGVPVSGAFDRGAMRAANLALGDHHDAPVLELSLAAVVLECVSPLTVSLSGAPCDVRVNDVSVVENVISLDSSDRLSISVPRSGARTYLAVPGGIEAPAVLGSVSDHFVAKDSILNSRDRVPAMISNQSAIRFIAPQTIRVVPGPQAHLFDLALVLGASFQVSHQSNRTGIRLDGVRLPHAFNLPSEPACIGAIQVTNEGQLIILGPDGPTIGGYPKIAVVQELDLDHLGQLRPGQPLMLSLAS